MWKAFKQIVVTGIKPELPPVADETVRVASRLQDAILKQLGRALTIRHVDAGSYNGCELEIHADMLLVTGPVSRNMEHALKIAYEATPDPKLVVAVGECGCNGGVFGESYASCGRVSNVIPVDVAVPGCPPPPLAILQGILTAVSIRK